MHRRSPPIGDIIVLLTVSRCLHLAPSDLSGLLSSALGDILDPADLECSLCMRSELLYCLIQNGKGSSM